MHENVECTTLRSIIPRMTSPFFQALSNNGRRRPGRLYCTLKWYKATSSVEFTISQLFLHNRSKCNNNKYNNKSEYCLSAVQGTCAGNCFPAHSSVSNRLGAEQMRHNATLVRIYKYRLSSHIFIYDPVVGGRHQLGKHEKRLH